MVKTALVIEPVKSYNYRSVELNIIDLESIAPIKHLFIEGKPQIAYISLKPTYLLDTRATTH